jgi:hypothetical protein
MAASGMRNVNGGFSAMNSKGWLTCPDPKLTFRLYSTTAENASELPDDPVKVKWPVSNAEQPY